MDTKVTWKKTLVAIVFFIVIGSVQPMTVAHAQTCVPECGTNSQCSYANGTPSSASVCVPVSTAGGQEGPLVGIVSKIVLLGNSVVVPALYALGFLYILIGLVRYFFLEGGGSEGREKGKKVAIYGTIGMVVLFSVWGMVNLVLNTLLHG